MDIKPFPLTTISAKNLGSLAMPDRCNRCAWLKVRLGFKTPWSSFPGIFGSIDSYSKQVTEVHMRERTVPPTWLQPFGDIRGQLPCPHWSKFSATDPATGIAVRGTPDERFLMADGTVAILDYKTSRFARDKVDTLMPMYRVQLAAYRWITLELEQRETSVTGLVYYSPPSKGDGTGFSMDSILADGFSMRFTANILPVQTDLQEVSTLIRYAKNLADTTVPPEGRLGCPDCAQVNQIIELVG